jgi:parvulin-like peptidyl-prolyl isomerase
MSAMNVSASSTIERNATIPLMTINGHPYPVKEALRRSMYQSENKFTDDCIAEILIREYALKKGISNSAEELQVAMEEMRYQKSLESKEKFQHWMNSNGQNLLSIQNELDYKLLQNKVKASIPYESLETYFAEFQLEYDRAELYSIRVETQAKAEELLARIEEEEESFYLMAIEHSEDEKSKLKAGYIGKVARSEVTAEIEAAVFVAQPGDVVGPVKTEKGFNLFRVAAIYPATLAAEEDAIRDKLFKELLAKLRAKAAIDYPLLAEDEQLV